MGRYSGAQATCTDAFERPASQEVRDVHAEDFSTFLFPSLNGGGDLPRGDGTEL